jgi:hypothetical protein
LAGFEVITYGRFWVTAEALADIELRKRFHVSSAGRGKDASEYIGHFGLATLK